MVNCWAAWQLQAWWTLAHCSRTSICMCMISWCSPTCMKLPSQHMASKQLQRSQASGPLTLASCTPPPPPSGAPQRRPCICCMTWRQVAMIHSMLTHTIHTIAPLVSHPQKLCRHDGIYVLMCSSLLQRLALLVMKLLPPCTLH